MESWWAGGGGRHGEVRDCGPRSCVGEHPQLTSAARGPLYSAHLLHTHTHTHHSVQRGHTLPLHCISHLLQDQRGLGSFCPPGHLEPGPGLGGQLRVPGTGDLSLLAGSSASGVLVGFPPWFSRSLSSQYPLTIGSTIGGAVPRLS